MGRTRREIREQILSKQVKIQRYDIPEGWSIEAADFINKCLQRKPQHRLGFNGGTNELKNHAWFAKFDWKGLAARKLVSPFIPDIKQDNFDSNHVNNQEWKDEKAVAEAARKLAEPEMQALFNGYYYNKEETKEKEEAGVKTTDNAKTIQTTGPQVSIGNAKDISFIN